MKISDILTRLLGVDMFCLGKKFLVYNLVSRNLKTKYRRSVFGLFWTLLAPIAVTCIYYFVFKVILQIQVPHYSVFILSGVLPWTFFAQTLGEGMESIVGNWGLVSKVPIPIQVFPFVNAITNLSTLCLSIPVLLGAAWISGVPFGGAFLYLPFFIFALFFMTYCLSLSLAILFVYFRDFRHMLTIGLQLLFYGTPVLYDPIMIPQKYKWILDVNPIAYLFTGMHKILARGESPSPHEVLGVAFWSLVLFALSVLFQNKFGNEIVEKI